MAIQQIDLAIREVEKRRDEIPQKLAELTSSVDAAGSELARLNGEHATLSQEIKVLEGSVEAENLKIRKWEKRLNDIRNQREYIALSRETESSKRANRGTEEQILELMGRREELGKQIEDLQDNLAEGEVDRDTERVRIEKELAEVQNHLETEASRRKSLLHKVPTGLMRKYDRIRKQRMGIGLAAASGGSCTACNMRLPPQLYNILQRADSIEQCPSCNRIVFFEGILEDQNAESQNKEDQSKGDEQAETASPSP